MAYRTAITINPADSKAWYCLGHVCAHALSARTRAQPAHPQSSLPHPSQAYGLLKLTHYSLYYFKRATALQQYDARMWISLGDAYWPVKRQRDRSACENEAQAIKVGHSLSNDLAP